MRLLSSLAALLPLHQHGRIRGGLRMTSSTLEGVVWTDLKIPAKEMRPNLTLAMGQCFNWKRLGDGLWVGMVNGRAVAIKQEPHTTLCASLTDQGSSSTALAKELRDYFQLSTYSLEECYKEWGAADARMKVVVDHLQGVRVVMQDPWECLVSFICSSNNNIKRITLMLDRLRRTYGSHTCSVVQQPSGSWTVVIGEPPSSPAAASSSSSAATPASRKRKASPGKATPKRDEEQEEEEDDEEQGGPTLSLLSSPAPTASGRVDLFTFPSPAALASATELELRGLGVGYRAKFIRGSALLLQELGGLDWLMSLRQGNPSLLAAASSPVTAVAAVAGAAAADASPTAAEAEDKGQGRGRAKKKPPAPPLCNRLYVQEQLVRFPGCGRKVADCISLFSLCQSDAIPVDTHVWAIAERDYNPSLAQHASITPAVYEAVGDEFRKRFVRHAGWAHSVLFAAELPEFRSLLPIETQADMKAFAEARAENKKAKREVAAERKRQKQAQAQNADLSETEDEGQG